ncbi:hypothetical protein M422DRAFT_268578 [Sphaerobolus stellatus SS14]|uniref:Uncharacterized protein n=1 Tax=Sphaerobolus stellatus (strain SS14) TaxID=990650 RepID=A0A0C9UM98_SPHS4|nr:hypothetical protein M422DRAFT_268578 [Sphaerobolus stellatus SS14]
MPIANFTSFQRHVQDCVAIAGSQSCTPVFNATDTENQPPKRTRTRTQRGTIYDEELQQEQATQKQKSRHKQATVVVSDDENPFELDEEQGIPKRLDYDSIRQGGAGRFFSSSIDTNVSMRVSRSHTATHATTSDIPSTVSGGNSGSPDTNHGSTTTSGSSDRKRRREDPPTKKASKKERTRPKLNNLDQPWRSIAELAIQDYSCKLATVSPFPNPIEEQVLANDALQRDFKNRWSSGSFKKGIPFCEQEYSDVYQMHLTNLEELKVRSNAHAAKLGRLQNRLYKRAIRQAKSVGVKDQPLLNDVDLNDFINTNDMDGQQDGGDDSDEDKDEDEEDQLEV